MRKRIPPADQQMISTTPPSDWNGGNLDVDSILRGGAPAVRIYSPCKHSFVMPADEAIRYAALIVRAAEFAKEQAGRTVVHHTETTEEAS